MIGLFNDGIKRIIDEINLRKDIAEEMERFSSHCFRHTFASRCLEAGVQPKTVQHMLGHSSLQTTMNLYTHVLDDFEQEEMSKVETIFAATFDSKEDDADWQYDYSERIENQEDTNIVKFRQRTALGG